MNKQNLAALAAVLFSLFLVLFIVKTAHNPGVMRPTVGEQTQAEETVSVVVAAVEIARGQTIAATDVTTRQWPKTMLPEGILTSTEKAVDRAAMTLLLPGEPIFEKKLASLEAGRGLEALVPEGMRAYTIQAKGVASNVAGFVLPGNRVDILLHLRGTNDDSGGGSTTTLLQAVEVLAVGKTLNVPAENRVDSPQSVTLLVTTEQATLLDLGQAAGNLSMALRNPADSVAAKVEPAILDDIRYRQEKPAEVDEPEPLPEPEPVMQEIIRLRGKQREIWLLPPAPELPPRPWLPYTYPPGPEEELEARTYR
jgi:pilus assembly protein CpaB